MRGRRRKKTSCNQDAKLAQASTARTHTTQTLSSHPCPGTNPFRSQWTFSSPLPFIDFLFVDYGPEVQAINLAVEQYKANPNAVNRGAAVVLRCEHSFAQGFNLTLTLVVWVCIGRLFSFWCR